MIEVKKQYQGWRATPDIRKKTICPEPVLELVPELVLPVPVLRLPLASLEPELVPEPEPASVLQPFCSPQRG